MDPNTMQIVEGGVVEEAIQALKNMHMILKRAKSDFTDVIKTTILLKSIKDFQAVNEIYSQCFTTDMPARAAFEVSTLDYLISVPHLLSVPTDKFRKIN